MDWAALGAGIVQAAVRLFGGGDDTSQDWARYIEQEQAQQAAMMRSNLITIGVIGGVAVAGITVAYAAARRR